MTATILVVQSESSSRTMVAMNLERGGFNSRLVATAEEALGCIRERLPDLMLLDWTLPGMNGLEFARRLRADSRTHTLPIIMLTARASNYDKVVGLESGVDDYVTKPFSPQELNARIRAILRPHDTTRGESAIEVNGLRVDPATRRVSANGFELTLALTEFRVLHYLMRHPRRVFSRAQMLDVIWHSNANVQERTVDVYIRRLRKELEKSGHHDMINTVRGSGYRFSGFE